MADESFSASTKKRKGKVSFQFMANDYFGSGECYLLSFIMCHTLKVKQQSNVNVRESAKCMFYRSDTTHLKSQSVNRV